MRCCAFVLGILVGVGVAFVPGLADEVNEPTPAEENLVDDTAMAGLRLNEVLASNRTGLVDDTGASSDWVEIHNAGTETLRLGEYWLTDDLNAPRKWRFPNCRILPNGYQLVWMSGRKPDSPSVAPPKASTVRVPFETTLIPENAEWKYLAITPKTEPSAVEKALRGWTTVAFDDDLFAVGPAGFGFGDEDDATEVPAETSLVLLRHAFHLEELPNSERLVLEMDYDDGFVAYLNGARVAAANAPAGDLDISSLATGNREAGTAERFDLPSDVSLLRRGKNVLSLAGLNASASSSDLTAKPSLGTLPTICHASFRLSKKGGRLYLVAADSSIVDQLEYSKQEPDQSLGRNATDKADWGYFLTPSPGTANRGPQYPQPIKSRVTFSPEPGSRTESDEVRIEEKSSADVQIRVTTDGSEPTAASPEYTGPMQLSETTLLRAAAFVGSERASPIVSGTYLRGPKRALPLMSVSMAPDDFRDVQMKSEATGRGSERPAFMEIFDPTGRRVVATGFGLRLHGGAGRRGDFDKKKSYRAYFRKEYGEGRLDYQIIPEAGVPNFDKLVLRANSNDRAPHGSNIRDQVIRDVHSDMAGLAASGAWCVLLVNAESRGVFNLTERMDEEFFASHLGPGQYDVMKTGETVLSGSREGWDELRRFVSANDFTNDDSFAKLAQRVDIRNLTSYVIVNLCLNNFDWPHNNWYAARRAPDGKWIFLCWDAEWGLGYRHPGASDSPHGTDADPYAFMDSGGASGYGLTRQLFLAMLDNAAYREFYQEEVRRHLNGGLATENILRHIRRHRDATASELRVEFRGRENDINRWTRQLEEVEQFARHAPASFQRYTDEYFSRKSLPSGESRVAILDAEDGRHVVYRTLEGQLHELTCSLNGDRVSHAAIRLPSTAPPAAGQPSIYSRSPKGRSVLYRGPKGGLHELSIGTTEGEENIWSHTDLTALLRQPVAICDPSVVVVDGIPHIVYVDTDSRPREFWFDGQWQHHPLPFAPRPAGDLTLSSSPAAIHVTYRTTFGSVCEQSLSRDVAATEVRNWSERLLHRLPAHGKPLGISVGGKRRLIFRVAEEWPLREPFVFRWNERRRPGYAEYEGPKDVLVESSDFRRVDQIGNPVGNIAGNPTLLSDFKRDQHFLAFRDTDGNIWEASWIEGAWQWTDASAIAEAPPALTDPAGIVTVGTAARYYVYQGRDERIHELSFDGTWKHRVLSESQIRAN